VGRVVVRYRALTGDNSVKHIESIKRTFLMLNMMFAGHVGADVDLREVSVRGETVKVANFSVAINNGKNAQGEDLPPTWIRVAVWRNYADVVANFVKKGDRVVITADNVKASAWQTAEGDMRAGLEVSARRVDFTGNRRNNTSNEPPF
jgi:single stranded DNA-binding protein